MTAAKTTLVVRLTVEQIPVDGEPTFSVYDNSSLRDMIRLMMESKIDWNGRFSDACVAEGESVDTCINVKVENIDIVS